MSQPLPPPASDDIARIARLRDRFLDDSRGSRRLPDYWRDEHDLLAYDRVLAARIGWKWDAALAECADRGLSVAAGATVLDFGCGTGIAARRFVARFGGDQREVLCHDRSPLAMAFAARALAAAAPAVAVRALADVREVAPDVLLVSHVLGELDDRGLAELRALAERARCVVIVEAGNHTTSRRLSQLRDELLPGFRIVAPCPHAAACPALANDDDWCHFFAPPPPEVFTDGAWVRTARELGIDLRSLPYAFVALSRDSVAVPMPPNRTLGRPKLRSRDALVQVCREGALRTATVGKREDVETWRALKKHPETVRSLSD
ncbi:MAG: methyltransferase domain-containing protein [Planctomycetes bacterium]|nr:methyltransferase domain-containing protein [Planctomycetota bacterium]